MLAAASCTADSFFLGERERSLVDRGRLPAPLRVAPSANAPPGLIDVSPDSPPAQPPEQSGPREPHNAASGSVWSATRPSTTAVDLSLGFAVLRESAQRLRRQPVQRPY